MFEAVKEIDSLLEGYEHIAWFIFSLAGFSFVCIRMLDWFLNKFRGHIEERQRMEYQASFFDLQENRYTKLVEDIIHIHKDINALKRGHDKLIAQHRKDVSDKAKQTQI